MWRHLVLGGIVVILVVAGLPWLPRTSSHEPLPPGAIPQLPVRPPPPAPPVIRGCRHDDLGGVPLRVGEGRGAANRTLLRKIVDARPDLSGLTPPWPSGVVILEIGITAEGDVRSPCVLRSIGAKVEPVALETVRKWRFTPALVHGKPLPCVITVTVVIPPPPKK